MCLNSVSERLRISKIAIEVTNYSAVVYKMQVFIST